MNGVLQNIYIYRLFNVIVRFGDIFFLESASERFPTNRTNSIADRTAPTADVDPPSVQWLIESDGFRFPFCDTTDPTALLDHPTLRLRGLSANSAKNLYGKLILPDEQN